MSRTISPHCRPRTSGSLHSSNPEAFRGDWHQNHHKSQRQQNLPGSLPMRRWPCFGGCSVAAPMSTRSMGKQDHWQVRVRPGLRERVATRRMRQAAYPMRRLQLPQPDSGIRVHHLQPSRRQAHHRCLPAAGGRHLPFSGCRFRRSDMAGRRPGFPRIVCRTGSAGRPGDLPFRQWRTRLGLLLREGASTRRTPSGNCHHQPYLRAHASTCAHFLRPTVPQSGHHAQGRVRKPHRPATTEASA